MRAAATDMRRPPVLLSSGYNVYPGSVSTDLHAPAGALVVAVAVTGSGRAADAVSDSGGHIWQLVAGPTEYSAAVVEVFATTLTHRVDGPVTVHYNDSADGSALIIAAFGRQGPLEITSPGITHRGGTQSQLLATGTAPGVSLALAVCGIGTVGGPSAITVDPGWQMIESTRSGKRAAVATRLAFPGEEVTATFSGFTSNVDAGLLFLTAL